MADTTKIDLIGRYLNDQMRPAERTAFEQRLGSDPALHKMLEAERLIRGTIRRDLDAMPAGHATTRMHVMDMLAKAPPRAGVPAGMMGTSIVKIIVSAVVGIGLIGGSYFLATRQGAHPAPPAAVATAPQSPAPTLALPPDAPGTAAPAPSASATPEAASAPASAPASGAAATTAAPVREQHTAKVPAARHAAGTIVQAPQEPAPAKSIEPDKLHPRVINKHGEVKTTITVEKKQE